MNKESALDEMYDVLQERKQIQTWLEKGEITREEFEERFAVINQKMYSIRMGDEKAPVGASSIQEQFREAGEKARSVDIVNHPPHYANRKYEVIDVMEDTMTRERFIGYLEGCTMKYLNRWDKKGKPLQDLEKAQWYLTKLIQTIKEEQV